MLSRSEDKLQTGSKDTSTTHLGRNETALNSTTGTDSPAEWQLNGHQSSPRRTANTESTNHANASELGETGLLVHRCNIHCNFEEKTCRFPRAGEGYTPFKRTHFERKMDMLDHRMHMFIISFICKLQPVKKPDVAQWMVG